MNRDLKHLTKFLVAFHINRVAHTNKTYLGHIVGVYRDLEKGRYDEDVCCAGMFHSIYGTEVFNGFKLPLELRGLLRELVGERAEQLAYLNCSMVRTSLDRLLEQDGARYRIVDRFTRQELDLSAADFDDLCRVHLFDWLEQVPRSQAWDYRREAYQQMAQRLGGAAQTSFERVYGSQV